MKLTVPGNLLLAGEYLVLDEGGQGLAVAVEPRAKAHAKTAPAGIWSIQAKMGETRLLWQPGRGDELPLAGAMMRSCAESLETRGKALPAPLNIEVDSSAFFSSDGRKAGFGSSAAAAVAIAMLTGRAAGLHDEELIDYSAEAALAGHRAAQGGRGSGYDIFTSLHGGCGIFTGGIKPVWQDLGSLPAMHAILVPGPAAVRSAEAVSAFRFWLTRQYDGAGLVPEARLMADPVIILEAMRTGVKNLVDATVSEDAAAFRKAMNQAGAAGRLLGEAIGYSACIRPPSQYQGLEVKALGAGNELGLMILDKLSQESLPPACLPFLPSGGPKWLS
jgi:phosphomevalonate kinase